MTIGKSGFWALALALPLVVSAQTHPLTVTRNALDSAPDGYSDWFLHTMDATALASSSTSAHRFSLLGGSLSGSSPTLSYEDPRRTWAGMSALDLSINVQAGHRITGIALGGVLTGYLQSAEGAIYPLPGGDWYGQQPGSATNRTSFEMFVSPSAPQFAASGYVGYGVNGWSVAWPGVTAAPSPVGATGPIQNLQGTQGFGLATAANAVLPTAFNLVILQRTDLDLLSGVTRYPGDWAPSPYAASTGGIGVRDLELTIYTQPVPEPATYALLIAGLGTLAAAVRRRAVTRGPSMA